MADTYSNYMSQISQARSDVGQRIAGLPQFETDLRTEVYGKEQAVPALREQISSKIRGLYDADKRNADVYANRQSPMYMRDPYAREKYISGQHQQELGSLQGLQNMLAGRQDQIGGAIEKGLQIYQAGVDAAKFQHSSLLDELNAGIAVQKARSSGTSTPKYKYSELVRQLMADPNTDISQYKNLRTDENFLQYLEANPEADYKAASTYLPDLVAYPAPPSELTAYQQLGLGQEQSLQQGLANVVNLIKGTSQEDIEKQKITMADIYSIVNKQNPAILLDPQARQIIESTANSKGIFDY